MLNIKFGTLENMVPNIDDFFKGELETEWLSDSLVANMLADIDGAAVISGRVINHPDFGDFSPMELSSGVKTLICALFEPEYVYIGSHCGDNCNKWFLEISRRHECEGKPELTLCYYHLPHYDMEDARVHIVNGDKTVTSAREFLDEYYLAKETMHHEWNIYGSRQ